MLRQSLSPGLLFRAQINEAFKRTVGRDAEPWEVDFFLPHFISQGLSLDGLILLLQQSPESFGQHVVTWPLSFNGWN